MNDRERGYREDYPDRSRTQERDLVVAPNEFAYVSDMTKGNINVHVGPMKSSLAGTDQLVTFDYNTKRFLPSDMARAKETFATAPEGWYLVLKNPAKNGEQPAIGRAENLKELIVGRKINIPGPVSFALWPGQMVKTIKGHILRSNQYLVVRVYDEQSARENWKKSVVKKADGEEVDVDEVIGSVDLTMGKLFIIKGTDVSFYIPPTGIEVVAEGGSHYVRDAVTLERLEYCILKDENGKKRYVKGPDVVFPEPTEIFLRKDKSRKFKAIELSPISGLYIKVIADYDDKKVGDELFITGNDQMIYFPREEHAIMKYGDKDKHYATAIPAGEARYVLNRLDGKIRLEKGPSMFLPDPRKEVLVRRILTPKDVRTWFPGNIEALQYNANLERMRSGGEEGYITSDQLRSRSRGLENVAFASAAKSGYATKQVYEEDDWDAREIATQAKMADVLERGTEYTKPRTVTIDSKYEGAVVIDVWTGYAVKIKSKTNHHKVIVGPATYMLEYDEGLEHMELSTGTPKNDDKLAKTAYLRVLNNKVSDGIIAETKDNCRVKVLLSYRVNFEGNKEKWFDVENYVKFMTDHMRSFGKALIKKYGIEEFYANPHEIIRDAFLGEVQDGKRPGRVFDENGMRIYEVEVLDVIIGDKEIEKMLVKNQNSIVHQNLAMAQLQREVEMEKKKQDLYREKEAEKLKTSLEEFNNSLKRQQARIEVDLFQKENMIALEQKNYTLNQKEEERRNMVSEAELARKKSEDEAILDRQAKELKLVLDKIEAEVKAVVEKGKAISPQLVSAIQTLGDMEFAGKLSDNMSVQAMLGGKSVVEVFQNLIGENNLAKLGDVFMKRQRD
jgi:major vault protein